MNKNNCLVLIILVFTFSSCSSAPSTSAIETAISQTQMAKPTDTPLPPTPTTPPTVTPTIEPIPLKDVDLNKALLTPEDIEFLGLYKPEEWKKCQAFDDFFKNWGLITDKDYIKKAGVLLRYPDCDSFENNFAIEEHIFLLENSRQSARAAEGMQPGIESIMGRICCSFNTESLSVGDNSIWLLRGDIGMEFSYMIIVYEEGLIYFYINGSSKLVKDDLLGLAEIAINKVRSAQMP